MTGSQREISLAVATVFAALFALTLVWGRRRYEAFRELSRERQLLDATLVADRKLIGEAEAVAAELERRRDVLLAFPEGRDVSSYWMSRIEAMADSSGTKLLRKAPRPEAAIGELFETPVEITEMEGTLEAFVRFLYEIQSAAGTLDVRELLVRPKSDDILRGRCRIHSIYRREAAVIDRE